MSKCIVVEDDAFWSAEVGAALAQAKIEVIYAGNGFQALEIAQLYPNARMVLDIILPEMDGVAVLKELRFVAPNMAVLAISGGGLLGASFYMKLARTFGAKGQLAKPFTPRQLLDEWAALAA